MSFIVSRGLVFLKCGVKQRSKEVFSNMVESRDRLMCAIDSISCKDHPGGCL